MRTADTLPLNLNDRRARAGQPVTSWVGVAICAALVTAAVTTSIFSGNRVGEQVLVSPPPIQPMPVLAPEPMAPVVGAHFVRTFDVSSFRRGNIHTHSNRSDGDSDPYEVYSWYRDHGYDFVAITDHNTFTNPVDFKILEKHGFIMLGGEEVTMRGAGRQVHVNALCTDHKIPGGKFATAGDALTHGVRQIVDGGGIALINHPNFTWGLKPEDLPAAVGARLFEIQSGHPLVHTLGGGSRPSHEALWDMGLTAGLDFMGVAVDDAHHLHDLNRKLTSVPGRAWIEVFATSLDATSICHALEQGMLYASTGPSLARISVLEDTYSIWPATPGVRVQFVGAGGRVLADRKPGPQDASVSYKIVGSEGYVRARVLTADGKAAWTPAIRVVGRTVQADATDPPQGDRPPG